MTLMISCSYAIESIHYSCNYAYKDVEQDITLGGNQSIYSTHSYDLNYKAISCYCFA